MIKVLQTAGNYVRDDIVSSFIILISTTPSAQLNTCLQMYKLIKDDITHQPLVQVATWCMGEYGHELVGHSVNTDTSVSEDDLVNIIEKVLNYNAGTLLTREYAINALMKLSVRITSCTE